ncbi:ImmA/IrrE family metallo-endopeptidase [Canibacter zhuwentaonis]|uniref:ImmA/IrrE family metallo-endopeptidase n=1 Tax=Canibacter zhuwentaonis TaxID=2837491 RepID=UPI002027C640|nr:ImmA/IrrE family metallo-endopeptidase [Canibacter zhuwentaonis]
MVNVVKGIVLDALGQNLVGKYYPDLLTCPGALDIEALIEQHLELDAEFSYLSQDGTLLGMTCFEEKSVQVWDRERQTPRLQMGRPGLIFVDEGLFYAHAGRGRFTLAHECAHAIFHTASDVDEPIARATTETVAVIECELPKRGVRQPRSWVEWQANRLGAAMLMPADAVRLLLAENGTQRNGNYYTLEYEEVQGMAEIFQVSTMAMNIRLEDLKLIRNKVSPASSFVASCDFDEIFARVANNPAPSSPPIKDASDAWLQDVKDSWSQTDNPFDGSTIPGIKHATLGRMLPKKAHMSTPF